MVNGGKVGAGAGKSVEGGMKLGVVYRIWVAWRPLQDKLVRSDDHLVERDIVLIPEDPDEGWRRRARLNGPFSE